MPNLGIEKKLPIYAFDFDSFQPRARFLNSTIINLIEPIEKLLNDCKITEILFYGEYAEDILYDVLQTYNAYSFFSEDIKINIPIYVTKEMTREEIAEFRRDPHFDNGSLYTIACDLSDLRYYGEPYITCNSCDSFNLELINKRELKCRRCGYSRRAK